MTSPVLVLIHDANEADPAAARLPARSREPNPDHERAELLLAEAETCPDPDRRDELRRQGVLLTLDLADRVAYRYRGRGMDADDLVQVGRMALLKAAHGYRSGCGSSFAAYAVPTISGEIKRHFRDHGWMVRPPRRLQELRAELYSEEDRLRHELRREPTESDLAGSLGLSSSEVRAVRACSQGYRAVSLDLPPESGVQEPPSPGPAIDEEIAGRDSLGRALERLSQRERLIVRLRFVEEKTQSEIGAVLGISQMQVSRLLTAILGQLREDLVASAA